MERWPAISIRIFVEAESHVRAYRAKESPVSAPSGTSWQTVKTALLIGASPRIRIVRGPCPASYAAILAAVGPSLLMKVSVGAARSAQFNPPCSAEQIVARES